MRGSCLALIVGCLSFQLVLASSVFEPTDGEDYRDRFGQIRSKRSFESSELVRDKRFMLENSRDSKKLVCYYNNQAANRQGRGMLKVDNVDPFLCTHLIYGYLGLDNKGFIASNLPKVDASVGQDMLNKLSILKRLNRNLKIMISIEEHSERLSPIAASPEYRANFVKSAMNFLERYNLDGLDLVWKYPNDARGRPEDKENFITLLSELKRAFRSRNYLLSAALPVGQIRIQAGIDVAEMSRQLDFMNLMSYDYNGGWDNETGLHAPLHSSKRYDTNNEDKELNVEWSVKYLIDQGADPAKMMLGVTTYGRSFNLARPNLNGINAPVEGLAAAGPYTKSRKLLGYNEICESFTQQPEAWGLARDPEYQVPYGVNGQLWVSYEDPASAKLKARFALASGLGGVTITTLDTDDFLGDCSGSSRQQFPIANAVKKELALPKPPAPNPVVADNLPPDVMGERPFSGSGVGSVLPERPATEPAGGELGASLGRANNFKLPVCGTGGLWWFPGPTCRDYIDCTSGTPILKRCRDNLLWKQERLWCDYPKNVPNCRD